MSVLRLDNVLFLRVGERPQEVRKVYAHDEAGFAEIKTLITEALKIVAQPPRERPTTYWLPDIALYVGNSSRGIVARGLNFTDYANKGFPLELHDPRLL